MRLTRRIYGCLATGGFCFLFASLCHATIGLEVNPQTVTVGQPVTVSGISDCETWTIDFGDGSPTETFFGPGSYSTVHIYTQPSPNPPGIWLVTAQGTACFDGFDSNLISVIVNPGPGGGGGPEVPPPGVQTGNLLIQRLNLHFENQRPQIRVEQNQKGLQAFAQIQYAGTGLLQGYWEVDGRIWSFVNRHLVFGSVVTLESPSVPGLPTVEPGVHRVRFVITQPAAGYTPPLALYFAGYDEAELTEPLLLASPSREARMPYEQNRFRWTGPTRTQRYEITFLDEETGAPVFTALTSNGDYELAGALVEDRFEPGRRYQWQVIARDAAGAELTRSQLRSFVFNAPPAFVPNQVLVLTEFSMQGTQTLARLRTEYGLRELENHRLESLDLQLTVFETSENVEALARSIAREEGVVLAHPNFILRTLSEPHARLQKVSSALNLEVLHQRARGRRVRVGIIDSGIDAKHQDLADRIVLNRSFVEDEQAAAEIHGTAVAGVIGASLNGAGIVGIAPEIEILALRACVQSTPDHPAARCETVDLARALDAALIEEARVVNMSFGTDETVPLLARLLEKGAADGVLFVAPVGNAKWQREAAFPARHPAVLAVGGQDEFGGEYPNAELYRVSRIAAPATNVFSSVPGDRYNFLSGTSLSSAIVTGLIAVALEQRSLTLAGLPPREADLCTWTERLTKVALCAPAQLTDRAAPGSSTSDATGVP